METDIYSEAINYVCAFYSITRDVCIEYYWDEVEAYMLATAYVKGIYDRDNPT